jgi:hypothetical protein
MSKRGGHLWILLERPLLAKDCRIYIHDLASRLGVPVKGSGLEDGIEIFPGHNDCVLSSTLFKRVQVPLALE